MIKFLYINCNFISKLRLSHFFIRYTNRAKLDRAASIYMPFSWGQNKKIRILIVSCIDHWACKISNIILHLGRRKIKNWTLGFSLTYYKGFIKNVYVIFLYVENVENINVPILSVNLQCHCGIADQSSMG